MSGYPECTVVHNDGGGAFQGSVSKGSRQLHILRSNSLIYFQWQSLEELLVLSRPKFTSQTAYSAATGSLHTLLEGTKPLSKNFGLDKQPVLPTLHQICQTRHRGHSTLRIENLSTFDDGRDNSLGHHGVPCREDLRIVFRPRGIERSKDSSLACGGCDSDQDGVDADARAAA